MREYYGNNVWRDYNSLQHWKYIYKKKVNGKWRYYYDIGKPTVKVAGSTGAPDKPDSRIQSYSKLEDIAGKDEKDAYARSIVAYNRAKEEYEANKNSDDIEQRNKSEQKLTNASRALARAETRYGNTPIGKLDKFDDIVDSGRKFISNLLTKAAKAISPKDEYLTKLSKGSRK